MSVFDAAVYKLKSFELETRVTCRILLYSVIWIEIVNRTVELLHL
jgi:hypothetical protein